MPKPLSLVADYFKLVSIKALVLTKKFDSLLLDNNLHFLFVKHCLQTVCDFGCVGTRLSSATKVKLIEQMLDDDSQFPREIVYL